MRIETRKSFELPLTLSQVTKNGQLVFSQIKKFKSFPYVPVEDEEIMVITPEPSDAKKVLKFLNTINGISWTPNLSRIERELRSELHDLMTIDQPTELEQKNTTVSR